MPTTSSLRRSLTHSAVVALALVTAVLSVGLTARPDAPFSITIEPVLLRVDPESISQARARAFGLDIDIKLGTMHLHAGWSAMPFSSSLAGDL